MTPLRRGPGARFGGSSCAEDQRRKDKSPTFFGSGPILGPNGQSPKKCILECQSGPPGGPKYSTLATHGSCLREASETPCSEVDKIQLLMSKCVFRAHQRHLAKVRRRASERHASSALLLPVLATAALKPKPRMFKMGAARVFEEWPPVPRRRPVEVYRWCWCGSHFERQSCNFSTFSKTYPYL